MNRRGFLGLIPAAVAGAAAAIAGRPVAGNAIAAVEPAYGLDADLGIGVTLEADETITMVNGVPTMTVSVTVDTSELEASLAALDRKLALLAPLRR